MKKIVKNIRVKLLFWLGMFLAVVFTLFGYLLINSLKNAYEHFIETTLSMAIKDLKYEFENKKAHDINDVKEEFSIDTLYIQILKSSKNGNCILEKSKDLKEHELDYKNINIELLEKNRIYFSKQKNIDLTHTKIKVALAIVESSDTGVIILQFAIPYDKYPLYVKNIILLLFVSLPLVLIAILIATNIIISRSLAQIKIVLDEVKDAKMGNPFLKIQKTDVAKEIDELIDTFNTLLEKIHLSHKKVREFGQNASHELKTPLTIIKGEVDVGLRRDRDGNEYKNILKIVQSEVFHLQDIIEKILFLSNNDENIIKESFAQDSILRIVKEVLDEKKTLANTKNIEIVVLKMADVTLFVNPVFLKIAIGNLVENAIKYSKNNSKIEISLTKDSLSIKDFGFGISREDIENIFDRFYRVDKVRSNASGSGLGLSIVKTIVDIHGFNIFVDSVEGKYTLFNIVFHK